MITLRKLLPLVNAVLCAVVLVLLIVDHFSPLSNIFLSGFVKALLLVTCIVSACCGLMLVILQRRRMRGERRLRRY